MSCWTLWQRMPPRYQLTMRDIPTDPHQPPQGTGTTPRASSASPPHSPRIRTPRGTRQASIARRRPSGEDPALTRGVLGAEAEPRDVACSPRSPVLPPRASAYIHNVKNQMRINSARRQLHEGSLQAVVPSTLSYSPKPRATTAPAFPITNPSNTEDYHRLTSPVPQRGRSGRRSPQPAPAGRREATRRSLPVSTLCPFGQSPPLPRAGQTSPCPRQASPVQHDCVIGEHQVAALYVDKGRVTFFRKIKPDVTQSVYSALSPYHVTCDDGSYLSHLRKAYLSGVRDLPKVMGREPDVEKHSTIRERMDYNRKVGRILDYYTQGDVPTEGRTPRPPNVSQSMPVSPFPAAQHSFRTLSSRRRHPNVGAFGSDTSPYTRVSTIVERRDSNLQTHVQPHPTSSSNGGFVRINARAPLHSRHFYLHTPARHTCLPGTEPPQTESGCVCGLCRLEMEVALMAQLHQDLGVSVDAATAAHLRASLEKGAAVNRDLDLTDQAGMNIVGNQDDCPARPNSVSGSRPSAAPSQRPESVSQGNEAKTVADQHPRSGDVMSTSTQTLPVVESTSLTVTLPVIEEINEVTQIVQEGSEAVPITNNNPEATATTEQTVLANNLEKEIVKAATVQDNVEESEQETSVTGATKPAENPEQSTSDTVAIQDSVTKSEQEIPIPGVEDSTGESQQETSDPNARESAEKVGQEVSESSVEVPVGKAEQGIPNASSVKDSVEKSEQKTDISVGHCMARSEKAPSDSSTEEFGGKSEKEESTFTNVKDSLEKSEKETLHITYTEDSPEKTEKKTSETSQGDSVEKSEKGTSDSSVTDSMNKSDDICTNTNANNSLETSGKTTSDKSSVLHSEKSSMCEASHTIRAEDCPGAEQSTSNEDRGQNPMPDMTNATDNNPQSDNPLQCESGHSCSADHPAQDSADHSAQDSANHSAQDSADHPAQDSADHPAQDSADHSAQDSADHPAQDSEDHPAQDSADHPAQDSADHSAQDSADHSAQDSADHPAQESVRTGNITQEPNAAEAHFHPDDYSVLEDFKSCDYDGETHTEANTNVSEEDHERGISESARMVENQILPDRLPSDSPTRAESEGKLPSPSPETTDAIIDVTAETTWEHQDSDVKGGMRDVALEACPPAIIISLASDHEDNETSEEDRVNMT